MASARSRRSGATSCARRHRRPRRAPAAAPAPTPPARPRAAATTALRLHPDPPHPPIFGVGGVLGGSTYLKDLAVELGPLQPFYTSAYPGLDDDAEPMTRIEDLATHFAA